MVPSQEEGTVDQRWLRVLAGSLLNGRRLAGTRGVQNGFQIFKKLEGASESPQECNPCLLQQNSGNQLRILTYEPLEQIDTSRQGIMTMKYILERP